MKTLLVEPLAENGGVATHTLNLPSGVRAPVSLNLVALGIRDGILDAPLVRGDIATGTGSAIQTDPGAAVSLSGKTITALGSIIAPGGSIKLTASSKSIEAFPGTDQALTTLYAGPDSVFSTAGTTVLLPDAYGRRIGSVLAGGDITLHGNVFADHVGDRTNRSAVLHAVHDLRVEERPMPTAGPGQVVVRIDEATVEQSAERTVPRSCVEVPDRDHVVRIGRDAIDGVELSLPRVDRSPRVWGRSVHGEHEHLPSTDDHGRRRQVYPAVTSDALVGDGEARQQHVVGLADEGRVTLQQPRALQRRLEAHRHLAQDDDVGVTLDGGTEAGIRVGST